MQKNHVGLRHVTGSVVVGVVGWLLCTGPDIGGSPGAVASEVPSVSDCMVEVVHGGHPVGDARVSIMANGISPEVGGAGSTPEAGSTTDALGRVAVRIAPGTTYTPYLERRGSRGSWMLLVLAPIDPAEDVDPCEGGSRRIKLPGTTVRVRVVDSADDAIIPSASVGVRSYGEGGHEAVMRTRGVITLKAVTGQDGEVVLPGLAPGRWKVTASRSDPPHIVGRGRSRRGTRMIEISPGQSQTIELRVEEVVRRLPYEQSEPRTR